MLKDLAVTYNLAPKVLMAKIGTDYISKSQLCRTLLQLMAKP